MKKDTTYKKTTVMFPTDVMRDLRRYLADNDLSSHDQSRIIVNAVKKFLEDIDMIVRESEENPSIGFPLPNPPVANTDQIESDIESEGPKQIERKPTLATSRKQLQKDQKTELEISR